MPLAGRVGGVGPVAELHHRPGDPAADAPPGREGRKAVSGVGMWMDNRPFSCFQFPFLFSEPPESPPETLH